MNKRFSYLKIFVVFSVAKSQNYYAKSQRYISKLLNCRVKNAIMRQICKTSYKINKYKSKCSTYSKYMKSAYKLQSK